MMPIDHADNHSWVAIRQWDVVFLLPRKVASSSVKRVIRKAIGRPETKPDRLDYVSRGEASKFSHRIGFCRHPLTRLESCYADKFGLRKKAGRPMLPDFVAMGFHYDMTFAAFVKRVCRIPDEQALGDGGHFRSQVVDLTHDGAFLPTLLCRFENLSGEWGRVQALVKQIGGPELSKLPHLRESDHSLAQWTEATREMAVERYRRDFEALGYEC
jgi:hypothetical protein